MRESVEKNSQTMKAFESGVKIEWRQNAGAWTVTDSPQWDADVDYRATKPWWRAFVGDEIESLLGLRVLRDNDKAELLVVGIRKPDQILVGNSWHTTQELLDRFSLLDGTGIGVEMNLFEEGKNE